MELTLIIFISFYVIHHCEALNIFGPQPKIISEDGNLIFQAAAYRNISLQTKGAGQVLLNGVDLSSTAKLVRSARNILTKYESNFEGSFNVIDKFESLIIGKNGISNRLTTLELKVNNFSSSAGSTVSNPKLARLNRQLKSTQDILKTITALLNKDECQSNPCANGGVCQDLFNDFICHCPDEWEGRLCDTDVNECARFVGTDLGCQNGATCINKRGSYQCLCTHGWYGIHCTRRSKDCNSGSASELCGHGTCVSQNTDAGYICICDQGWTTDGSLLDCSKDVDECKMNRSPCSVNPLVTCENTPGSFRCGNCPPGYTGNGYYCSDINECLELNGGCSMNPLVECINTVGSRKCGACPPGYVGDGVVCTYKGICNVNNGGCHSLATCKDYPRISSTFVECTCPLGYSGNGMGPMGCTVSNLNFCSPNPCKNGDCIINSTSIRGYTCKCKAPYFGVNCDQSLHPCANNPCRNGGMCVNSGFTFKCVCTGPWTGPTCSTEKGCGGVLRGESGNLKYPLSNSSSRAVVRSCAWLIEAKSDGVLNITFKQFHSRYSPECNKDWLQIHDGRNSAAHLLGRFCGNDLPKNGSMLTTHNAVYIWFRSDISSSSFELEWNSTSPICTYNYNITTHGAIQSPGSPGKYPNNRDCFWYLVAPAGKRILFHFFSLDIGNSLNCTQDFLEFFGSINDKQKPFAQYCNSSTLPSPLYSPGPEVYLHFHSDEKGQNSGFQISYSVVEGVPGCGGTFSNDHGEIKSPSYRGKYISDLNCDYKIKLAQSLRIKIEFVTFELEHDQSGCQYDFVAIYDGPNTNSPLIGRYCGVTPPEPFISNGNEVTIQFKTDWAVGFQGFVLRYETVCGRKYSEPSGIIESDGYPVHYTPSVTCLYEIVQPLGYIIELSFLDFDLESGGEGDTGDGCYDYVEIRDGDNENATLIGKYCDAKPPFVVSSLNYLWMKFTSDESIGGTGFRANYTTTKVGCGGIMKEKAGTISSPGTEGSYDSNSHCNWVIMAPSDSVIRLTWVFFQTEQKFMCESDYVLVYDNNTVPGRGGLIGKYCGNKLPPSVLSTSNIMTIIFVSDETSSNGGFTLSYNFIEQAKLCGGDYHSVGGVIRSPGFPKKYSINTDCTWTITVPPGQQILLNITTFELEEFMSCRYDWLEIKNGKSASSPLIGRFCGKKIPKTITSHANQIYIHFKSDIHGFGAGFEIIWESTTTGCGGILSAPSGSIISPMYPESYNKFTNCYWKISTSSGSLVQLIFTDLDLEPHSYCLLDYVEIFDGSALSANSLGRFCGPTHSPIIKSTQNHVFIYFHSDISFEGRGFQLQYSTVCKNNLTGFYGVIESPNFPNEYPVVQDCTWNIDVLSKNRINITFAQFDIRMKGFIYGNQTCPRNYLEIKYLSESSTGENIYESYGKYCGRSIPKMIHLNHDHVQIRYVTDVNMIGTGFRLEWALDGCGGKLYREGSISSPNYPKRYPESSACRWELETDIGSVIEISFIGIDIERINTCEYDSIKVYSGSDNTYPLLGHFCHQDTPIKLTSVGNKMSVYFTSDVSYQGKGFIANFTSINAKCGGKMTIPKGTIFSPNYPKNYDRNDTCEWLLEVDENHLIDLEFEDVELLKNQIFCKKNYINVYDGPSEAYPILANICGNQTINNTITSTHNTLFVKFQSYAFMTSKGFKANFYKACGARIVASVPGNIRMHREFLDNERLENCTWTLLAPEPNKHVSLLINYMNTADYDCSLDYHAIKVYEGESSSGRLLGEFCGIKVPPTITSTGNSLHVSVSNDANFFATYSSYDSTCGGTLISFEGKFASPNYPRSYQAGIECEWTLKVSPGNHITLNFEEFDLLESEKCKIDFLEIRQDNSSGKILGTYCGTNKPENITNIGSLWVYFKSSKQEDMSAVRNPRGFIGEYNLDHDNVVSGSYGQIASPLYPDYFWSYGSYTWKVSVEYGKKISFTFKEIQLESYSTDDCSYSGLKIYDGIDNTAALLKSVCDLNVPEPITTTSNEAFIEVDFNQARTGSKFLLEWLQKDAYFILPVKNTTKIEGCGSKDIINVNDLRNYTLTSPGYPIDYEKNLDCEWIFSTTTMNHLDIYFDTVDLEAYYGYFTRCYLDYIELYSRKDESQDWEKIETVCNHNSSDTSVSVDNLLKVKFVSNYDRSGTGFKAEIKEVCGGSITDQEGFIIFDDKHARGRKCEWNVTVKAGRRIKIEFPKFNIASGQEQGCKNYLTMRNGHYPDSPLIGKGKYCGNQAEVLNTTGNQLYVKYQGSPNVKGFVLHFEAITHDCGGLIELNSYQNSTIINSPNYPNIPSPHIECIWVIRSPPGTSIKLDFKERFDLSYSEGCTAESLELRNGATEFSPIIDKFCETMPSTQFSTDNTMFVKYITDINDPRNGFKAEAALASCGGTMRGTSGKIKWSSVDKGLYQNQNCTWRVIAPDDHYLIFKFDAIHFRTNFLSCIHSIEKVTIYSVDSFRKSETLERTVCNNSNRTDLTLNGNEAVVRYIHPFKTSTSFNTKSDFTISYTSVKQNCTHNLNTASGTIKSPGYPNRIYSLINCKTTITVPEGRRITLKILDLDLDDSLEFHNQGIAIFDGSNIRVSIGYIRGNNRSSSAKRVFKSSSNSMLVYFWSASAHGRGFLARYTSNEETICKGSLNEASGTIVAPNETQFCCSFKRNQPLSPFVTLKASFQMQLGYKSTLKDMCRRSKIGAIVTSDGSPRVLQFEVCNNTTTPLILRTPVPKLELQLWKEDKTANFTMVYNTYECGGIKSDEIGSITSPNFPNKPSTELECSWLLKLPKEQQINLTFSSFDLGDDCDKNNIEIHNGMSQRNPKIGKFCKQNKPGFIISERNSLLINYHFAKDANGKGFNLTYQPIINGCGGIFHDKSRVIQTPNYPKDYPDNAECLWEIRAPQGYHIGLSFIDRFHIEESDECADDFLKVWDWKDDQWRSMKVLCGRDTPLPINSTGIRMKILFRSNSKIQARGFKAKWEFNCGGVFEATNELQYIVSPGYPMRYPNNIKCEYELKAPTFDQFVNIDFVDFLLEDGMPTCVSDNVTIKGSTYGPIVRDIFCGTTKPLANHYKDRVIIKFSTDSWVVRSGFKFSFNTYGCGGNITSPTKITSPNHMKPSNSFYDKMKCEWNITAPDKKIIVMRFEKLSTPYSLSCSYDNIAIFNGSSIDQNKKLATFCGNLTNSLPTIASPKNSATVLSYVDISNKNFQFTIDIFFTAGPLEGCGGIINLTSGQTKIIQPPNINEIVDCNWQFIAPIDHQIEFEITDLNLPKCTKECSCNFIEVRDGGSSFSTVIRKICNSNNFVSTSFQTSTRYGFLRYHLKDVSNNAFRIAVKPKISICGKTVLNVTEKAQVFTSPNYPNQYPENVRCKWIFKSKNSKNFVLKFKDFDMSDEGSQELAEKSCQYDSLEIEEGDQLDVYGLGLGPTTVFSGRGKSAKQYYYRDMYGVHIFCGKNNKPFDFYSTTDATSLIFQSKYGANRGRGFKLEYQLIGCNQNYTDDSGKIMISLEELQDCIVGITVSSNKTISLYFKQFIGSYSSDCSKDSLTIIDGDLTNGKQIEKWCGYQLNPVFSFSNQIWFKIHSENDYSQINIELSYTSTDKGRGCGGSFYEISGEFSSPLYPNDYRKDSLCTWDVRGSPGSKLEIDVHLFDIQAACNLSNLIITTYNKNIPNVHTYCKDDEIAKLISDGKFSVTYQSSVHNGGRGWMLNFVQVDYIETGSN